LTHDCSPAEGLSHLILPKAMAGCAVALAAITVAQAALPSRASVASLPAPEPAAETTVAAPAPRIAGPFDWARPVADHPIISPFGLRQLPWEEQGRLHAGVDIAAPAGTSVRAAAHGVVVRAGQDGGYGRFVEIRHAGGLTSLYAHLGSIAPEMKPGLAVMQGTVVGLIGNTGSSTGAHLHMEVRDSRDRPLNPEMFLGQHFASAEALPLKAASRFPRRIRVAYVSYIPKAKREQMEAREQGKLEAKKAVELAKALKVAQKSAAANSRALPEPPTILVEDEDGVVSVKPSTPGGRVHASLGVG
jgi:hypothetical protein